jgi:DNA-binding NarL/FixJ family response regulator
MQARRIFVIWTHPLFLESVRLLLKRAQVELVGSTSDRDEAHAKIETLTPDIVIIEQTDGEEQASLETISILQSGARVIRLSMDDNEINLYSREHRTAVQADDLANLIVGNIAEEGSTSHDG